MSDVIKKCGKEPNDVFFTTSEGWTDEALKELNTKYNVYFFKGEYAVRRLPNKDIQIYYEDDGSLCPVEWSGKKISDYNLHEIFELINKI